MTTKEVAAHIRDLCIASGVDYPEVITVLTGLCFDVEEAEMIKGCLMMEKCKLETRLRESLLDETF